MYSSSFALSYFHSKRRWRRNTLLSGLNQKRGIILATWRNRWKRHRPFRVQTPFQNKFRKETTSEFYVTSNYFYPTSQALLRQRLRRFLLCSLLTSICRFIRIICLTNRMYQVLHSSIMTKANSQIAGEIPRCPYRGPYRGKRASLHTPSLCFGALLLWASFVSLFHCRKLLKTSWPPFRGIICLSSPHDCDNQLYLYPVSPQFLSL